MRIRSIIYCTLILLIAGQVAGSECISIIGGMTRQATVQPGSKIEGKVFLRNTSDKPGQVKIYQTDYLFYANGKSLYGDPGKTPRSNASWITYTPHQFTIPPKEIASVYYTIQVPEDPKLFGTYWSMLMVEPIATDSLEMPSTKEGEVRVGIHTVMRYAIQMVTSIGETGARNIRFADKQILTDGSKRVLQMDIENVGERWLNPMVWAEIYDENGLSLGRFEGNRMRLYPECSGRFQIDLSQLAKGDYNALVVADNGDEHVFGSQYKLAVK